MKRAAIALALILGTRVASADEVDLPKTLARLIVPDDWKAVRLPGLVTAYKRPDGALLAVTRADVPNADAWIKDKKAAYADQVFAGLKASLPAAKKLTKKLGDMNGVPALDVETTRDGAPIVVRVLLFRTYALSLAIELPTGADIAVAREIAAKFGPAKPVATD